MKARKQLDKELILRGIFAYWRLQNNPEYIAFYKEAASNPKAAFDKTVCIPPVFKSDDDRDLLIMPERRYPWIFFNAAKFGLAKKGWCVPLKQKETYKIEPYPLINPFQIIEWTKDIDFTKTSIKKIVTELLENTGGPAIIEAKGFDRYDWFLGPILVDVRYDKKEIFHLLSQKINLHRNQTGIFPLTRDPINKFSLYAQVWDLRKGYDLKKAKRLSFPEIAKKLTLPIPTVKSRFRRAYELLFDEPYDKNKYENAMQILPEKDRKTCRDCSERNTCKAECPDIILHLRQLEGSQVEKLSRYYEDEKGEWISTYEKAGDKHALREWQKKQTEE